jgi:hypothetical protein
MLEVASEKLTERELECVKHFRQAQERGGSFAEYCRAAGLKANEWHAVRHGMVQKGLLPGRRGTGAKRKPTQQRRSRFIPVRVGPCGVSSNGFCGMLTIGRRFVGGKLAMTTRRQKAQIRIWLIPAEH